MNRGDGIFNFDKTICHCFPKSMAYSWIDCINIKLFAMSVVYWLSVIYDCVPFVRRELTYLNFRSECRRFQTVCAPDRTARSRHPVRTDCPWHGRSCDSLSDYAVAHQAVPKAGLRQGDSLRKKKHICINIYDTFPFYFFNTYKDIVFIYQNLMNWSNVNKNEMYQYMFTFMNYYIYTYQ